MRAAAGQPGARYLPPSLMEESSMRAAGITGAGAHMRADLVQRRVVQCAEKSIGQRDRADIGRCRVVSNCRIDPEAQRKRHLLPRRKGLLVEAKARGLLEVARRLLGRDIIGGDAGDRRRTDHGNW